MEVTEPIAYGELGLLPTTYEALQVREFYAMLKGKRAKEKESDLKRAYFLSWLVNLHSKRNISTTDILKPLYPEMAAEEIRERQKRYQEESSAVAVEFAHILAEEQ